MCSRRPSSTCNSSSASMTEWSSESESSIVVPTNTSSSEEREVFDISNLSKEDLQALRKKDPFLYYSIPSVRRAELGFTDTDSSSSCSSKVLDSSSASAAAMSDDDKSSASTTVKRCKRVSFECHPDLLLEEYLSELDEQFGEEDLAKIDLQFSRFFGLE